MIKKMEKRDELMAELIVQKSRPLLTLWASQLSLYAFRLLDVYLTKIDMHDEASRTVIFYKQELEQILDVDRIRTEELDKILDTLLEKVQIVDKINGIKAKIKINLFETATTLEDENGVKLVKMECTQTAKKYFFNIEQIGYLKYRLKHITPLKSRYSYVLFTFLESNRFRPKFEIKIEKLKKILRCEKEEQYKEFKRFNDKVLKKAKDELEKKISYKFTYKTIKIGRNVTSIWFELAEFPTVKEIINMPAQTTEQPSQQHPQQPSQQNKYPYPKTKYVTPRKKPGLPAFEYKQWDFDDLRKIIDKTGEDDDDALDVLVNQLASKTNQ